MLLQICNGAIGVELDAVTEQNGADGAIERDEASQATKRDEANHDLTLDPDQKSSKADSLPSL